MMVDLKLVWAAYGDFPSHCSYKAMTVTAAATTTTKGKPKPKQDNKNKTAIGYLTLFIIWAQFYQM